MPKIPQLALPRRLPEQLKDPVTPECNDSKKCMLNEHFICGNCNSSYHNMRSLIVHTDWCMK